MAVEDGVVDQARRDAIADAHHGREVGVCPLIRAFFKLALESVVGDARSGQDHAVALKGAGLAAHLAGIVSGLTIETIHNIRGQ